MFGAGTAAVVSPINKLNYNGVDYNVPCKGGVAGDLTHRFMDTILAIQVNIFGRRLIVFTSNTCILPSMETLNILGPLLYEWIINIIITHYCNSQPVYLPRDSAH